MKTVYEEIDGSNRGSILYVRDWDTGKVEAFYYDGSCGSDDTHTMLFVDSNGEQTDSSNVLVNYHPISLYKLVRISPRLLDLYEAGEWFRYHQLCNDQMVVVMLSNRDREVVDEEMRLEWVGMGEPTGNIDVNAFIKMDSCVQSCDDIVNEMLNT